MSTKHPYYYFKVKLYRMSPIIQRHVFSLFQKEKNTGVVPATTCWVEFLPLQFKRAAFL